MVQSVVDHEMVRAYWEIGREIVEDEQKGETRAGYGENLLKNISKVLTARYGKGFDYSNLKNMRQFYQTYPIGDALRSQLSWTHYRLLMRIEEPQKRSFYEIECATGNWSTRELERQMSSMLFERLALSRDKDGVSAANRNSTLRYLRLLSITQDNKLQKRKYNLIISMIEGSSLSF